MARFADLGQERCEFFEAEEKWQCRLRLGRCSLMASQCVKCEHSSFLLGG